jgi:hypothetical protein
MAAHRPQSEIVEKQRGEREAERRRARVAAEVVAGACDDAGGLGAHVR